MLYDPRFEHDACGVGLIAHLSGARSHGIVARSLTLLRNLAHRSAVGCDPCTGDGSGILLQTPHYFLARAFRDAGIMLPDDGEYGVGVVFLPRGDRANVAEQCSLIERVATEEGLSVLGWRDVPVDSSAPGDLARVTMPAIRHVALGAGTLRGRALERRLYLTRKRIEHAARAYGSSACYVPSMSSRTMVYKGLLRPDQLPQYFPDLADPDLATGFALVHSRFSTNTFPTWSRAHPYRMVCHNGEINTLRGNLAWMRVREPRIASHLFGRDIERLVPIIDEDQSDSACFDNALEFLVMGGYSLAQAIMMMIPEAWESNPETDPDRRAFYEHHAAIMEPWDGPAAIAFTDGIQIGATLDRNGLRPARYIVTHDDFVVLASEAGALSVPPEAIRTKGRLHPGRMLLIDTAKGRILDDDELKNEVAARRPYREWVDASRVTLDGLLTDAADSAPRTAAPAADPLLLRAFGYTAEELRVVLAPMAATGEEAVGSMGNDAPLAVLSDQPQLLFAYFRQLFAQVTNPAIDPIREQLVMSLAMILGPRPPLLDERAAPPAYLRLPHPVLASADLDRIRAAGSARGLRVATLSTTWDARDGALGLGPAIGALCDSASRAVCEGSSLLVLSDRDVGEHRVAIPTLLATSAVHQHLIRERLRADVGLIAETGEARDVTHLALLIGYGAGAVSPYLALETVAMLARDGWLPDGIGAAEAQDRYVAGVKKGLLKILSKMGISTLQSYCGAQVFEVLGLARALVDRHFTGTVSPIDGIDLATVAEETLRRHHAAYGPEDGRVEDVRDVPALDPGGEYHYRIGSDHHAWNPGTIAALQRAARGNDAPTFAEFSRLADAESSRFTLRGLFQFSERTAVPIEEVEPASAIVRRFTTGAMSFGALSIEAHETLAIAMNRLGGRSNTGEGGEDPTRFGTDRSSAIKQVASARFGVTTQYLVNARELQIKIAQGAKPGEGGQLPGHKVDEAIAAVRYAMPGVTLISPPPHHDIYSIEDLAQLIFDLKNVNPAAAVSVKLVAEAGVGTVAAGVAKAHADLIVISGDSGGTGASPWSSIKRAGIPWEIGLAETHQTLVLNGLRSRVRLQTDGQLKTARDVVVAAILGAEEFGFSTAPLIVEGCVMMRKCHLNTCPVGIATQDPVLRAKFAGQPEHVVNFFFLLAEEVRALMARLGVRTVDDLVGQTELLRAVRADHWKANAVDVSALLYRAAPVTLPGVAEGPNTLHCTQAQDHGLDAALDSTMTPDILAALSRGERVDVRVPIRTAHRAVGAMLAGEIARSRPVGDELRDDTIRIEYTGSAGQSFGAFAIRGLTLRLVGEANDYVGKGLSGGRLVIVPPRGAGYIPEDTTIIGNTALYGATSGEAYIHGVAGERFAVRNSGATAVVEGIGDHGCEYMTGGIVVVLGRTGRNFAAGMSGGIAFVLDPDGSFRQRCNTGLVGVEQVDESEDWQLLEQLLATHAELTGSGRARRVLRRWRAAAREFVRVMPREYQQVLTQRRAATG